MQNSPSPSDQASDRDDRPEVAILFSKLVTTLPELETLLDKCSSHWVYEDGIYRFYHQSFKVYSLQSDTLSIVQKLQTLAPDRELNPWFMQIIADGTRKIFSPEHNKIWAETTRPIVEAFFHARYFLEMAAKYGRDLEYPPRAMPSGWAALLHLYNLR